MSHSLPRRYFKKLISNLISLVSGFIVTSLAPRALGPSEFGKFSFITDVFSQIYILLEGGSSNALYNKISHNHENAILLKKYSRFLILVNIMIFAGVLLCFTLDLSHLLFSGLELKFVVMGLIYASLFWINSIYVKVLDGLGQTALMEQQRIYMSVLKACGVTLLFFTQEITLLNFFVFQILVVFALNLSFLKLIHGLTKQYTPKLDENFWNYFYTYSSPLFIYGMISALANIGDRWLLQKYSGLSQQGYFSLATQLGAICFLFSSSLTPLFHREIAIATNNANLEATHKLIYKSFPVLFFIAAMLGVFGSMNASGLILLIAGDKYSGQNFAYALMFLYPIHQTYGQLVGSLYYASGETKLYRNIGTLLVLVGAITSFFLLAPTELFGLNLGFTGIALKNVALQLFNVHILLYFSFKKYRIKLSPFIFNQIIVLLLLSVFAYIAKTTSEMNTKASFLASIFINGAMYLSLIGLLFCTCYKMKWPILMKYTQENFEFAFEKINSLRTYFK